MINIIATVSPTSANSATLRSFSKCTNIYRLNASHGSLEWHRNTIDFD